MMSLGVCCVVDLAAVAAGIVVACAVPCAHTRFPCSAPAVIQVLATRRVVILISWFQVQVTRAPRTMGRQSSTVIYSQTELAPVDNYPRGTGLNADSRCNSLQ